MSLIITAFALNLPTSLALRDFDCDFGAWIVFIYASEFDVEPFEIFRAIVHDRAGFRQRIEDARRLVVQVASAVRFVVDGHFDSICCVFDIRFDEHFGAGFCEYLGSALLFKLHDELAYHISFVGSCFCVWDYTALPCCDVAVLFR